ncbi:MAG TPA: hypothetical protein VKY81_03395, partial [Natronosporangium sp.]|nr:hypothetical protein [Natronosporangium sp.]
LWEVCDTTSSCQDYGGRAYVRPTADTAAAAERYLREELGLEVETEDGSSGSGCRTRSHWCRRRCGYRCAGIRVADGDHQRVVGGGPVGRARRRRGQPARSTPASCTPR